MNRKYPRHDVKNLYGKSAGRCNICKMSLALETEPENKSKQIGKIAHITAHKPDGPRANEKYPADKIDSYDNWILLCPTCHDKVDNLPDQYTVEVLLQIKSEHELWVNECLDQSMSQITFAELEVAAKAIASINESVDSDNFHVIPPERKIQKNGLTNKSKSLISMGLSRSSEVNSYLVETSKLDPDFTKRLKEGFKQEYMKLSECFSGDDLFMEMFEFSKSGLLDFTQQAAGLAILSYLFHLCEVFESDSTE